MEIKKSDISIDEIETIERRLENLSKLVNINTIINSTLDIRRLLTIIMEIIKDIMVVETSTLLLYDESDDELIFKVALGEGGGELVEKYRVKVGQGIAGYVAETRKGIIVNDAYEDKRFDPNFDKETGFNTRSILCTPLLFKGRLLGVIQAINPKNRPLFEDEDMKLFNVFSNQAALAVQNAIFFQKAVEDERITGELKNAGLIQSTLIPDINKNLTNFQVAAKSISAREIGGEFHALYNITDQKAAISICDIHEKGIPGGLHASVISGALKALTLTKGSHPTEIMGLLSRSIGQDIEYNNISFFYGVIDLEDRVLKYVNAGIAYPILIRDGVARYLKFRSKSLNQLDDIKQIKVKLQPGDSFAIITDGLLHLKNRTGQMLGLKNVMDFLQKDFNRAEDMLDSLISFGEDFAEGLERREDISLIILKIE
jgi:phosphoserine phosphatase RsbU/P